MLLLFFIALVAQASVVVDRPFIIGVAGGTASGKTQLTSKVVSRLDEEAVSITQDSFYRDLLPSQDAATHNFDAPSAFDFDAQCHVLNALRRCERGVRIPDYDYAANARRPRVHDRVLDALPRIVVFEGILALYDHRLRDLFDLKVFVDADADVRLARRIRRDIKSRGRDLDGVLRQYLAFVKPSFDDFCHPTKRYADVIVPRGAENEAAIDIIVNGIRARTRIAGQRRLSSGDVTAAQHPAAARLVL
ncbi:hypothetical protein CTAYLR_003242 [Chrysophaeum taylorii]|uniref:uridine/cytidine kinase n=1 Tax=Chrysophaeum taylorii TaxID=2483200 RepID=A0AAD7XM96_9STRA|nr:hypothetical protein CTAYLR_003242 [Chrysophaeum taylorii]